MEKAIKTERIDLRVTPEARDIIQKAATELHATVSQFILQSALNRAKSVLAERSQIGLNAEQWSQFMEALDAPPRKHARMERLLNEPTILD